MNGMKKLVWSVAGSLVVLFVVSAALWPAGCPSWKRQSMQSASIIREYARMVEKYVRHNNRRLPLVVTEVLQDTHGGDCRRQMLCRAGIERSWKPDGWLTNNCLVAAFSDYVFVVLDENRLLISERPGIGRLSEVTYGVFDKTAPCQFKVSRIGIAEFEAAHGEIR